MTTCPHGEDMGDCGNPDCVGFPRGNKAPIAPEGIAAAAASLPRQPEPGPRATGARAPRESDEMWICETFELLTQRFEALEQMHADHAQRQADIHGLTTGPTADRFAKIESFAAENAGHLAWLMEQAELAQEQAKVIAAFKGRLASIERHAVEHEEAAMAGKYEVDSRLAAIERRLLPLSPTRCKSTILDEDIAEHEIDVAKWTVGRAGEGTPCTVCETPRCGIHPCDLRSLMDGWVCDTCINEHKAERERADNLHASIITRDTPASQVESYRRALESAESKRTATFKHLEGWKRRAVRRAKAYRELQAAHVRMRLKYFAEVALRKRVEAQNAMLRHERDELRGAMAQIQIPAKLVGQKGETK
mgnify:FL=1